MTPASRRSTAGLLALAVAVAGAAAAWLASPSTPAVGAGSGTLVAAAQSPVVEAGRALFVANCASCHGSQGEGGPAGPSLVGAGAASADFYLRTGRMPLSAPGQRVVRQEPHFGEADIEALVAYVASLGPGPSVPQVAAGGDIHRGWQLFQANCAACHNATGSGNAIGGGFVAVNLGQADARTIGEATVIGPGAMPAFGFDAESQAALAAYIKWLSAEPAPGGAAIGQTGPVAEGFVGVAVGLPLLLLAALFIARTTRRTPTPPDAPSGAGREGATAEPPDGAEEQDG
jgi:ubiquinol-cytochrome c reductase cytochrome c subunit